MKTSKDNTRAGSTAPSRRKTGKEPMMDKRGVRHLQSACEAELTHHAQKFTRVAHTDRTAQRLELVEVVEKYSDDGLLAWNRERIIEEEFSRRYVASLGKPITEADCIKRRNEAKKHYGAGWEQTVRAENALEQQCDAIREKARESLADSRRNHGNEKGFSKSGYVVIANRGEIACRVLEQAHEAGKKVIALHDGSDFPYGGLLNNDDEVFYVPVYCDRGRRPEPERLDIWSMKALAFMLKSRGIDLFEVVVHPGWGFNAEDDAWFTEMERLGFRMAGPGSSIIRFLGNKINATEVARQAGLSTPQSSGKVESVGQAMEFFTAHKGKIKNFLLKDALGGGGYGQLLLRTPSEMEFRSAVEKFLDKYPVFSVDQFLDKTRHVEFQFLSDMDGNVLFGAPRDCTQQRDRQKVIEETAILARAVEKSMRQRISAFLAEIARRTGGPYVGAGTFEFLYEPSSETFYFLEVNTRLQVEHPVSGHQDGVNYVRTQLDIADGYKLKSQHEMDGWNLGGHTMEARICLERILNEDERAFYLKSGHDRTFGPITGGVVNQFSIPEIHGLKVYYDRRIREGVEWAGKYDPMIMKTVVHGEDRLHAIELLKETVERLVITGPGISTNQELILGLLDEEEFLEGKTLEDRKGVKNVILRMQIKNETGVLAKKLQEDGKHGELNRLFIQLEKLTPLQADRLKAELAALGAVEAFKLMLVGKRGGVVRTILGRLASARGKKTIQTTIYPQGFTLLLKLLQRAGAEPSMVIRHFEDRKAIAKKLEDGLIEHDPELFYELLHYHKKALKEMTRHLALESHHRVTLREKNAKDRTLRDFLGEMEEALYARRREFSSQYSARGGVYFDIPEKLYPVFETLLARERGEKPEDMFIIER
ncbi:MAG: hypothetical protein HY751_07635 [Nitrospinae bacterium]|nr:hypothetical protein [Nitrospinota bacterium]